MSGIILGFIVVNLLYACVKLSTEASDALKNEYRQVVMSMAQALPFVSYLMTLAILSLNYLSVAKPGSIPFDNPMYLYPLENLVLLVISTFLLTPAGSLIAGCLILHFSLRYSYLFYDGIASNHGLYFTLLGFLSLVFMSVDKFTYRGSRWLLVTQRNLRSLLLYTVALLTLVSMIMTLENSSRALEFLQISSKSSPKLILGTLGAITAIGWYQVMTSRRHKDTMFFLIIPSLLFMITGLGFEIVHLVFPLFVMIGLAICLHDDYCRDRLAMASALRRLYSRPMRRPVLKGH